MSTEMNLRSPKIAVGVVDWNGHAQTMRCLKRIAQVYGNKVEIVVIDNNSEIPFTADNLSTIGEVDIIRNSQNLGFADACNQICKWAMNRGHSFAMILNNDVLVEEGFLEEGLSMMALDNKIAVVGPRVEDDSGFCNNTPEIHTSMWLGRTSSHSRSKAVPYPLLVEAYEVQWLSGAALLLRIGDVNALGGFHSQYFLYWEDTDLGLTASENGKKSLLLNSVVFRHIGKSSTREKLYISVYYGTRNRHLLIDRHGTLCQRLFFKVIVTPFELPILTIVDFLLRREMRYAILRAEAIVDGLKGNWGVHSFRRF